MEIKDFTRLIWKKGKENTSRQLAQASRLFHDCEYQTVLEGQRIATTTHLSLENLPSVMEQLNKDGMVFTPCKQSGFYQGFAHKHKEVKPGEPYFWFGCITRTVVEGEEWKEAERTSDHPTMGKMLGYPECCTAYFKDTFPKNYDPVWLGTDDVPDGDPAINSLLRYFGVRIISHLSCSPYCEQSLNVGQERITIMRKMDSTAADWLLEFLASPMTWNSYHGVVEIDTPNFLGLTHTFPIMGSPRIIKWRQPCS